VSLLELIIVLCVFRATVSTTVDFYSGSRKERKKDLHIHDSHHGNEDTPIKKLLSRGIFDYSVAISHPSDHC